MTVDEIINLLDCYVDGWGGLAPEDLLNHKMRDSCFYDLLKSVTQHGFLDPICIQNTGNGYMLGNGHHRLALAVLLCYDETLSVVISDDDYMETKYTNAHCAEPEWTDFHYQLDNEGHMSFLKLLDAKVTK